MENVWEEICGVVGDKGIFDVNCVMNFFLNIFYCFFLFV